MPFLLFTFFDAVSDFFLFLFEIRITVEQFAHVTLSILKDIICTISIRAVNKANQRKVHLTLRLIAVVFIMKFPIAFIKNMAHKEIWTKIHTKNYVFAAGSTFF